MRILFSGSGRLLFTTLSVFLMALASITSSYAASPLAPRIENAYAESSTKVTVVFYGKVATVGDSPTTYTATSSPGQLTGSITSLGENGRGAITVDGLKGASSYTFTVTARNSDGSSESYPSALVTTLKDGLLPVFSTPISTSTGFTTQVTNFDLAFTYSIKSSKGNATIAPYDGSIVVENIGNPGELASITVTTSRTGYDSVSSNLSARSKSSSEPSKLVVKASPKISRIGNVVECSLGSYDFLRNGKYSESPTLTAVTYLLEISNTNISIFSSDDFKTTPRFLYPNFSNLIVGSGSTTSVKWDISTLDKKTPIRCITWAFQEGASINVATPVWADPSAVVRKSTRTIISCKKGDVVRRISAVSPKCPRGYSQIP